MDAIVKLPSFSLRKQLSSLLQRLAGASIVPSPIILPSYNRLLAPKIIQVRVIGRRDFHERHVKRARRQLLAQSQQIGHGNNLAANANLCPLRRHRLRHSLLGGAI